MKKITINYTFVIYIAMCIIICVLLGALASAKDYNRWLAEANDYKRELIEAYEMYFDATENILNADEDIDSFYYQRAKERLDSLYATQE